MLYDLYLKEENKSGDIVFKKTEYKDIKIMGKSIEEIMTILNALELERITDIKVTMKNLNKYCDLLEQKYKKTLGNIDAGLKWH